MRHLAVYVLLLLLALTTTPQIIHGSQVETFSGTDDTGDVVMLSNGVVNAPLSSFDIRSASFTVDRGSRQASGKITLDGGLYTGKDVWYMFMWVLQVANEESMWNYTVMVVLHSENNEMQVDNASIAIVTPTGGVAFQSIQDVNVGDKEVSFSVALPAGTLYSEDYSYWSLSYVVNAGDVSLSSPKNFHAVDEGYATKSSTTSSGGVGGSNTYNGGGNGSASMGETQSSSGGFNAEKAYKMVKIGGAVGTAAIVVIALAIILYIVKKLF